MRKSEGFELIAGLLAQGFQRQSGHLIEDSLHQCQLLGVGNPLKEKGGTGEEASGLRPPARERCFLRKGAWLLWKSGILY